MMDWTGFYHFMDGWLMPFYRWPDAPILGFLLGTAVLAAVSVVLGDLVFNFAVWLDRKRISEVTRETVRLNNLSIEALQSGQGDSYRACNKLANDAFGKMFFLQVALSAASLAPLPFAMAWMQYRFFGVDFLLPWTSFSIGFAGMFLLIYIAMRVFFGRIKHRLPVFRTSRHVFQALKAEAGTMKSWRELVPAPAASGRN